MNEASIQRMEKSIAALKDEFNAIRTGRASAALFDKVRVDYYGQPTPLNQVATVSVPEARSVVIQPFDKTLIGEIEKAPRRQRRFEKAAKRFETHRRRIKDCRRRFAKINR